jgi:hypothetical protein
LVGNAAVVGETEDVFSSLVARLLQDLVDYLAVMSYGAFSSFELHVLRFVQAE